MYSVTLHMRRIIALCLLLTAISLPQTTHATESVTIRMVLNNTQARVVRGADDVAISVNLTAAQKSLVRVRAPKFQGSIIRVAASQISPTNKISLKIIKHRSATPVLRVVSFSAAPTQDLDSESSYHKTLNSLRVELKHLKERLDAANKKLEKIRALLLKHG